MEVLNQDGILGRYTPVKLSSKALELGQTAKKPGTLLPSMAAAISAIDPEQAPAAEKVDTSLVCPTVAPSCSSFNIESGIGIDEIPHIVVVNDSLSSRSPTKVTSSKVLEQILVSSFDPQNPFSILEHCTLADPALQASPSHGPSPFPTDLRF
ncbi:hypothetical protein AAC387_Pa06g2258 [Persea americana]